MKKENAKIDVAVMILFFCRDKQLKQVFEAVKKARPARLYLCQDGPRGPKDEAGINACRAIVDDKNIDWECEVHRWYREKNVGCDPSGYQAQKWLFEHEEMGIILEDDVVPSQSFFFYCKELLDKYKDNRQVSLICGMNNLEVSKEVKDSYFFTKIGGIWGWATWKRFVDTWDSNYTWLADENKLELIKSQLPRKVYKKFIFDAKWHRDTGKEYFETLFAAAQWLERGYAIVPKYNLTTNVGLDLDSAHNTTTDLRCLPKAEQKLFYMKAHEIEVPLKHPAKIERNFTYEKKRVPNACVELWRSFEHWMRVLRYSGFKPFFSMLKRRIVTAREN